MPPSLILAVVVASTTDTSINQLSEDWKAVKQRRADYAKQWDLFQEMNDTQRGRRSLASYWCKSHHCSLAVVWSSPLGQLVHLPRYRLSPSLNAATSTQAGRARNAINGNDQWPARTLSLQDLAAGARAVNAVVGIDLTCPHVRRFIPVRELLNDVNSKRVRTL